MPHSKRPCNKVGGTVKKAIATSFQASSRRFLLTSEEYIIGSRNTPQVYMGKTAPAFMGGQGGY